MINDDRTNHSRARLGANIIRRRAFARMAAIAMDARSARTEDAAALTRAVCAKVERFAPGNATWRATCRNADARR